MALKIGIMVGSLRKGSFNRLVAQTFEKLLPREVEPVWIEVGDLPLYNEDLDTDNPPLAWQIYGRRCKVLTEWCSLLPNTTVRFPRRWRTRLT